MKIEMKILTKQYDDNQFNKVLDELIAQDWDVKRQYGGTVPNFEGHGAELTKTI